MDVFREWISWILDNLVPLTLGLIAVSAANGLRNWLGGRNNAHRVELDWLRSGRVVTIDDEEVDPTSRSANGVDVLGPSRRLAERRSRASYANFWLQRPSDHSILDSSEPIPNGEKLELMVSLGPVDSRTQLVEPTVFPTHRLPAGDVRLQVMVASADFYVGVSPSTLAARYQSAEQSLILPGDGEAAITEDGGDMLHFFLVPILEDGVAQARINFYYRDALIQSHLLTASLGMGPGGFRFRHDYTASEQLDDLHSLPDRARTSILLNDGQGSSHTIVLRQSAAAPPSEPVAPISLPAEAVGPVVDALHRALAESVLSTRRHSKRQLIDDLRRIAPLGRELHRKIFVQARGVLTGIHDNSFPGSLISICRPSQVTFTLPWNALYSIGLPADIDRVRVCPLVTEWDERAPLVERGGRRCPREPDIDHSENLLCPFGFWGYGLDIEAPASAWSTAAEIPVRPASTILVAHTTEGIDKRAFQSHLDWLQDGLDRKFPEMHLVVRATSSKPELREALTSDVPILYFLCHGERSQVRSPDIRLGIGKQESISVGEFTDWVEASYRPGRRQIWADPKPLVFINACEALEVSTRTLTSYVDAFVGGAQASAVMGTEVSVPQGLAMEYAQIVFDRLLLEGDTMEGAVEAAQFSFLADGNLLGLVYDSFSWAHLRFMVHSSSQQSV